MRINTRAGEQHTPEYRKINPRGKVPALQLADGQVLTENGAILPYLADLHPERALLPTDPLGRARAQEWLAWCASAVHVSFHPLFNAKRFYDDESAAPRMRELALAAV